MMALRTERWPAGASELSHRQLILPGRRKHQRPAPECHARDIVEIVAKNHGRHGKPETDTVARFPFTFDYRAAVPRFAVDFHDWRSLAPGRNAAAQREAGRLGRLQAQLHIAIKRVVGFLFHAHRDSANFCRRLRIRIKVHSQTVSRFSIDQSWQAADGHQTSAFATMAAKAGWRIVGLPVASQVAKALV